MNNIKKESSNLNEDIVDSLNQQLVAVYPIRTRTLKGSFSIKKILFKSLFEQIEQLDWNCLNNEDRELIERYKALDAVDAKIKSFLPKDKINALMSVQNKARVFYKGLCIDDEVPYMTMENYEELKVGILPFVEECNNIIKGIVDEWGYVKYSLKVELKKIEKNLTEKDIEMIVNAIPSPEKFKKSYDKAFLYECRGIEANKQVIDFASGTVRGGEAAIMDELNTLIEKKLKHSIEVLDATLYGFYHKNDKQICRMRKTIKALARQLIKSTSFLGNVSLENIANKLNSLCKIENDYELTMEAEMVGKTIIDMLLKYEYIDSVKELDTLVFTEEKMQQLTNAA